MGSKTTHFSPCRTYIACQSKLLGILIFVVSQLSASQIELTTSLTLINTRHVTTSPVAMTTMVSDYERKLLRNHTFEHESSKKSRPENKLKLPLKQLKTNKQKYTKKESSINYPNITTNHLTEQAPPLPTPESRVLQAECPSSLQTRTNNTSSNDCNCHSFEDGAYLDCGGSQMQASSLKHLLDQLDGVMVRSMSLSQLNQTDAHWALEDRLDKLFNRPLIAQQLQITGSALDELEEQSFAGLGDSLRALSLTGGLLRKVRRNALRQLRSLLTLDLDSNALQQIQPYAFYALPLQQLSVQSNQICTLHEHSFGGLEATLQQLSVAQNCLTTMPLLALSRLQRLRSLQLAGNRIRLLQDATDSLTSSVRLMELEHLDLSENKLTSLEAGQLDCLPRLVSLALAGNQLNELADDAFLSLENLDTLDLARNRLRILNPRAFRGLRSLRSLDLSSNHLHELHPQSLRPLAALNELFLTGNTLQRLSNRTFESCAQLGALFISNNALSELELEAFVGLSKLQQLHLSGNRLQALSNSLFAPTANSLRTLALDGNLIAQLPPQLLSEQTQLHELRLQRNLLKHLPLGVLDSCERLQELHLQSNRLERIEPEAFQGLRSLQYLDAAGNRLQQLPGKLGGGALRQLRLTGNQLYTLMNLSLADQPLLEALWLDQNRLSELVGSPFEALNSLQKLHLERNELQSIASTAFSGLTNLQFLDLAQNGLRELHFQTFAVCEQLIELHLEGNHLLKLSAGLFKPLISLRHLYLQNNQLLSLEAGSLAGLRQLRELNIRQAMLEQMPDDLFDDLVELRVLDLSSNPLRLQELSLQKMIALEELRIRGINLTDHWISNQLCKALQLRVLHLDGSHVPALSLKTLLKCLNQLQHLQLDQLNLSDASLLALESSFTDQEKFTSLLDLEFLGNQLDTIPSKLISHFPRLQSLQLSANRFKRLFPLELQWNADLQTLNLSRNSISVLDPHCLCNLIQLHTLDLSDNVIRFLQPGIFVGMQRLQHLRLERNWLAFLPNVLLRSNLSSLRTLHLTGSPLTRIREDLSTDGELPQLLHLYLNLANLSVIASHDFRGFPSLKTLNLAQNQINSISPGAFRTLTDLRQLDLSKNLLRLLPAERLGGLHRLESLNLSHNVLAEFPPFHQHLIRLQRLDVSRNRLSRIESLGWLGESLLELRLAGNMITWLDGRLFENASKLQILDLSRNHLTHLPDTIFLPIELNLQQLILSENPIHCDCGLLSLWEFLEEHSRLISGQTGELFCTQPDRLTDVRVRSLQPADFCPAPKLTVLELLEAGSDLLLLHWNVLNDSLVGGFSLHVQAPDGRGWQPVLQLPASQRSYRLEQLEHNSEYTLCVQADGRYLRPLSNPPTPYVLDRQRDHVQKLSTSNRKCIQARTLEYQKRTPIQLSTFGLIVLAATLAGLFLLCSIVLILGIRYRRSRLEAQSPPELKIHDLPDMADFSELPEVQEMPPLPEFISYQHFSLPSAENVYS